MQIATWNVLHRIHAENWGDGPLERFPREADRIAAITSRVAEQIADGCTAICLQEVSGDQLASLRPAVPADAQLFVLRYPRVPRPKHAPISTLADPTEHLVTIIADDRAVRGTEAMVYPDDGGKGFLAVALAEGGGIVNTHVTFGDKRAGQLGYLGACASAIAGGPTVIVGDFNADRETVAAALGTHHTFAIPTEPALPTRPRPADKPSGKSQTIDHIIVRGGRAVDCAVVDIDGLSDHNLVVARITAG
jgi:endonuclease/exonuclease/phosphatase family metal-dependent hydrolase